MPIKGLTDRTRLLPRLGKIHLGVRVKGQGRHEYPRATPYFVVDDTDMGKRLKEHLGADTPTQFDIWFPTNDHRQWADPWYRAYSSYRGLVCKGDGETAHRMVDVAKVIDLQTGQILPQDKKPHNWPLPSRETEDIEYFDVDCPGMACPDYQRKACRQSMCLQFMIPDFPIMGVWQIDTSSWTSIKNILDAVEMVKGATGGHIAAIPLLLRLEPKEVAPEGVKKKVYTMNLVAPFSARALREAVSKREALPQWELPPGSDLSPATDLYVTDVEGKVIDPEEGAPVVPPEQAPPPQEVETPAEQPEPKPRRRQRPTATPTRRTPDESPELQKAWERVKEKVGQASDQGRSWVFRWLAMTSGKEIPANLFGLESVPPIIPTRLIYQLEADFEQITSGKTRLV